MLFNLIVIIFSFLFRSLSAEENSSENWADYYEQSLKLNEPYNTLLLAERAFEREGNSRGIAIDLGTGTGKDALYLLRKGWNVFAMDRESLAIEILLKQVKESERDHLEVAVGTFVDVKLPNNVDLVNASLSLPFCPPEEFSNYWKEVVKSIAIGGRFSGHFFGPEHSFYPDKNLTFHTKSDVIELFSESFELEYFEEMEKSMISSEGEKNWHLFKVVAKKIN